MLMVKISVIRKNQENLFKMAIPRLKDKYISEIIPLLKEKFQYKSVMQVPKVVKIAIVIPTIPKILPLILVVG